LTQGLTLFREVKHVLSVVFHGNN